MWGTRLRGENQQPLARARLERGTQLVATDPDREGEFIAWRLAELLGSLGAVKRVTFNEITKTAIATALEEAGDVDIALVEAAMIRRLMDRLIGFRGSRFCRS